MPNMPDKWTPSSIQPSEEGLYVAMYCVDNFGWNISFQIYQDGQWHCEKDNKNKDEYICRVTHYIAIP